MRKFERDRKENETDAADGLKAPVPFRDEKELMEHHKKKTKGVIIDKGSDQKGGLDELIDQEIEQKKLEEEKKNPLELMRKMKPLVYPLTKKVFKFQEFGAKAKRKDDIDNLPEGNAKR